MNRQSQWLFEAPVASEATSYTNPYSNPEWETERELQEINTYALGEEEWEQEAGYPPRGQTIRETISGFSRYSDSIKSLPLQEQKKIDAIAQQIINSYRFSRRPILTVRLVGHADRDMPRRPDFEKRISGERAQKVRTALIEAVERLSKPLRALPPISIRINWPRVAAGATRLVVQKPVRESERARNRRVEIYLSTARFATSSRLHRSVVSRESSDPKALTPKLEAVISKF